MDLIVDLCRGEFPRVEYNQVQETWVVRLLNNSWQSKIGGISGKGCWRRGIEVLQDRGFNEIFILMSQKQQDLSENRHFVV